MAITAAGLYGLTLEKMLIDTAGQSLEAETHKELMVTDASTPDFDTHDFRADVDGAGYTEVSGSGYTSGGTTITTTEVTLSGGTLTFDAADTVFTTVTVTDAMAGIIYFNVGTSATDQLVALQDFVTAASSTSANFTIQHNASGIFTIDYTP